MDEPMKSLQNSSPASNGTQSGKELKLSNKNASSISSIINSSSDSTTTNIGKESTTKDVNKNKRPRKKRKISSCDVCRKFKTRCDFEPSLGKCHRCKVLDLECSLDENGTESNTYEKYSADKRLLNLENEVKSLNAKIDTIISLLQDSKNSYENADQLSKASNNEGTSSTGTTLLDENTELSTVESTETITLQGGYKLKDPPLKLINGIDERLFPSIATNKQDQIAREQRPSAVARVDFLKFYEKHQLLCHKLSKEFLVRSHFWIIPGGMKDLSEEFIHQHLFITSVFTIIAMSFADNDKYAKEQETLYPLVERLLTNTLTMFEKLIPHDIEAILYCAMFHISRKAKRYRQLKFNSLVLINFAMFSLLKIVDFHKIKERVLIKEECNLDDLYHLRILNSLTACHIEYCISYGEISPQDSRNKEFNHLIAKFPQSNFGDDIKLSEINLGEIVNNIFLDFKSYFTNFMDIYDKTKTKAQSAGGTNPSLHKKEMLIFPELNYWLKNWEELLAKDGGGVLLFTFDYYHILICRSFFSEYLVDMKKSPMFLNDALHTMKEHSFSLLRGFLRLPTSLIKGAPIFTTSELVYACLTLCDFLHWFDPTERQQVLSICTRVYWHLNTIGEKLNEATDNVGKIIKSIIDTSKKRVSLGHYPSPMKAHVPLMTKAKIGDHLPKDSRSKSNIISQNHTDANKESIDIHKFMSSVDLTTQEGIKILKSHKSNMENVTARNFHMPDVDKFSSFEDFFQDFFTNLKPNSQKIFSTPTSDSNTTTIPGSKVPAGETQSANPIQPKGDVKDKSTTELTGMEERPLNK
ncbi:Urc2p NDAI_0F04500 [Naumovozyma dairenensis CBS 421]|uniref:Zn(2)-C6 fungal-type domain-containing protein n=1 Tax=Naumovozyma dairenensis (strain ATCC 10597 / BCRC 20456 / CBS 421 / NBRC 0211 / NRRL Y-12639) TaxID=1071378 RepID=G0WDA7_NAUDC|nr:hypothetical protein NDAI_0F04500 [Naumovozyma dairenensis CBS 421]CCD25768.1 hypothetical protein NDAI_0F04500 [Naumovozyma dairenensis CBS 421]